MLTRPAAAAASGALLGVSALFLSSTAAQAADRPNDPVAVAHRGASSYAPENTLAAVDKAKQLRVAWVENDVQRTKDGELVILHDTDLKRTTNVEEVFPDRAPWKVADFTLKEIKRLDAGSWFSKKYAGQRVPTLEQYLERVTANRQKLLMEIKAPELYPGIEAEILNELRREGWLDREHIKHRLIIQSFSTASVQSVHALRPAVKTGFLGTPAVAELPSYARFTDQINPSYKTVTADYVDAVHKLKGAHGKPLEVYTWTVNEGPLGVKMARLGVDGIISNSPDVIRAAVAADNGDDATASADAQQEQDADELAPSAP